MPALRFKTCRLLEGNVWNRELAIRRERTSASMLPSPKGIRKALFSLFTSSPDIMVVDPTEQETAFC
jgi:hypothetical protein